MGNYYANTYWLLGDGADAEAEHWVAHDDRKKIVYSSPRAVEIVEGGSYLAPELLIPPKPLGLMVISNNEADAECGPSLGVAIWGGPCGWIEPTDAPETESIQTDTAETAEDILAEEAFLEELRQMSEDTGEQPLHKP